MNLPIEGMEAGMPVRFINYEIVRESGGQGLHPGGNGVRKTVEVLVDDVRASVLGERTKTPAVGISGGSAGALASFQIQSPDGGSRELAAKSGPHRLMKGDRLVMTTAGGGGWGQPGS
ncbi:MAG: hydantoinase B/oxoprolinase family protein, partial [Alcaligenaceae bacterium]|nr:hydantoinase B/oxoprolinase family protein [Alcaligenaceae bacterium]